MNIFCPLLPIQVKPALTKGEAVLYKTIATNISGEDAPRKQVLCKCLPLASVGQPTNSESTPTPPTPTATTTATTTTTTTTTAAAAELDIDEDQPEVAWRTCLKRTIQALETGLVQKEREAQAIKKSNK
ncbi:hypothetical protein HMPREF1544_12089 [Mucor circinelloides 1006PhL]|uniref:Uncharacterized protein n=1 Tax=Mucor circinelloides f. circinelloides (strain 1006PhL) TaxID=1220926 RepID=S2JFA3_MUCC1|nr:hypothetical protein HMPREF1544_12089 [Mucor circinelloides 1006PhL]